MEPVRYQHGVVRSDEARFGFKIIKFCQGLLADDVFYAFIAIEPQNLGFFENHYTPGAYSNFAVFGEELLRGWGSAPPDDIVAYLQSKYGIEFGVDRAYILHLSQLTLQANERADSLSSPFPEDQYEKEYPEKPAEALGS